MLHSLDMGQLYQKREKDPLHHDLEYKDIISVANLVTFNLAWKMTLYLESTLEIALKKITYKKISSKKITPKKMALIGESASFRSAISQMKEKDQLQIRIAK